MNSPFMSIYLSFCVLICLRTYVNSELYHAEYENSTNTVTCIARTVGYVAFCGSTSYPGEPELELLSFWYHNGWYQHGQLRSSRRATRHHNLRHRLPSRRVLLRYAHRDDAPRTDLDLLGHQRPMRNTEPIRDLSHRVHSGHWRT